MEPIESVEHADQIEHALYLFRLKYTIKKTKLKFLAFHIKDVMMVLVISYNGKLFLDFQHIRLCFSFPECCNHIETKEFTTFYVAGW